VNGLTHFKARRDAISKVAIVGLIDATSVDYRNNNKTNLTTTPCISSADIRSSAVFLTLMVSVTSEFNLTSEFTERLSNVPSKLLKSVFDPLKSFSLQLPCLAALDHLAGKSMLFTWHFDHLTIHSSIL
jgi:hypothetical protein